MVVTGAAGFIGSHVAAALAARGHLVAAIDRLDSMPGAAAIQVVADVADAILPGVVDQAGEMFAGRRVLRARRPVTSCGDDRSAGANLASADPI